MPQNKELKLTKPCRIGASQLNSSVGPTVAGATEGFRPAARSEADVANAR